jgi:hypothetical protein
MQTIEDFEHELKDITLNKLKAIASEFDVAEETDEELADEEEDEAALK